MADPAGDGIVTSGDAATTPTGEGESPVANGARIWGDPTGGADRGATGEYEDEAAVDGVVDPADLVGVSATTTPRDIERRGNPLVNAFTSPWGLTSLVLGLLAAASGLLMRRRPEPDAPVV